MMSTEQSRLLSYVIHTCCYMRWLNCLMNWYKRRLVNLHRPVYTIMLYASFWRGFESPAVGGYRHHVVCILYQYFVSELLRWWTHHEKKDTTAQFREGQFAILKCFPMKKEGRASSSYFCWKELVLYCSTPLLHILRIWLSYFLLSNNR